MREKKKEKKGFENDLELEVDKLITLRLLRLDFVQFFFLFHQIIFISRLNHINYHESQIRIPLLFCSDL